jgi:uncharacterized protein
VSEEPALRPLPQPDEASEGFWAAAREHRLAIQHCGGCGRFNHAPTLACQSCGSFDLAYRDVSGKATLSSWTVVEHPPAPAFRALVPFIVGVVELAEQPGLVLATNILDAAVADLCIGMPLEITFEDIGEGVVLPQFRPSRGQG